MQIKKGYVNSEYLQLLSEIVEQHKLLSYELLHLKSEHNILDVGCGPGIDTVSISNWISNSGKVIGIDHDEEMIRKAEKYSIHKGAKGILHHIVADAGYLPFKSCFFDAIRCERVFQHISNTTRVFSEICRVTKPGGWIVVLDTDWSTLSFDTLEVEIENKLKEYRTHHFLQNGLAGRQLYRMFINANLSEITIKPCPVFITNYALGRKASLSSEIENRSVSEGFVTNKELIHWQNSFSENGTFFSSVMQFLVAGKKI